MRSLRRERNKAKTKSQVLTKGGVYDYDIGLSEISILSKLIDHAPANQLSLLLDALLTKRELVDITRRLVVGQMLTQNKTYDDIGKATSASRSTISLVNQSLSDNDEILYTTLTSAFGSAKSTHSKHIDDYIEKYFRNRVKKGK